MPDRCWNVFYSYSHADEPLRDELAKFLAPLKYRGRIAEWYDRKIDPGLRWESEISGRLESADLILLLVSSDFLASDYCFGVEMEMAMRRMSNRDARVVPILLRPCLWKESRFSELQLLPRDARPVTSWPSPEDAFTDVAGEIDVITKEPPPAPGRAVREGSQQSATAGLTLVKDQIFAYARLYERIRQQMPSSDARTVKLEEAFQRMKARANASFPLLPDLAGSHSPGDRLAAVSILECFASPQYLPFLVERIRSEAAFAGYHAACAMEFAVSATEPRYYPQLRQAIDDAIGALEAAVPGCNNDRKTMLSRAQASLKQAMEAVTLPQPTQP